MTMLNRFSPSALPQTALKNPEIRLLDHLVKDRGGDRSRRGTLSHHIVKVARLGGYLARAADPPPGNTVIWRGLSRLTDIDLVYGYAVSLLQERSPGANSFHCSRHQEI
ncbi:hypothetical protein [Bradyrhizobium australiense]|uniref:hypothetical protein n=1 Tax=Bradyrhizobium australiense TaxID=2721161 RepID=UPI001F2919AC|nr:hypothetical protein [Bradyrhizobium australiense]